MQDLTQIIQQIERHIDPNELATWYDTYIGETIERDDELIDMGEILPMDDQDFIVHAMRIWVDKQEGFFAKIKATHKDPFVLALAFSQRGITYEEFKHVLHGKPKDYKHYGAFY